MMHHHSPTLTIFGINKLRAQYNLLKERYAHISQGLKDRTQSGNILTIMRLEQEIIASDMMNMDQVLSHAKIIEKNADPVTVEQGTKVVYIQGDTGAQTEVTLVDPLEADPSEGFISINSPVGSMLLGHHVNDTVSITTPKGINQLTIVGLE